MVEKALSFQAIDTTMYRIGWCCALFP